MSPIRTNKQRDAMGWTLVGLGIAFTASVALFSSANNDRPAKLQGRLPAATSPLEQALGELSNIPLTSNGARVAGFCKGPKAACNY